MKNFFQINSWLIPITIVLYFTLWGGVIAHITLCVIQIAMSMVMIYHFKELSKSIQQLFIIYNTITVSSVLLFIYISHISNRDFELMILFMITTMILAVFHLIITYKIKISND